MEWEPGKPKEPGTYIVKLHDQGGWPWTTIFTVKSLSPISILSGKELTQRKIEYARNNTHENVLMVTEALNGFSDLPVPISDFWNWDGYIKIEIPKV